MTKPTVYTLPSCTQCQWTKRELLAAGIEFDTIDLSTDEEAYAKVSALGYKSAPVVISGDNHWAGYRPDKIKELSTA